MQIKKRVKKTFFIVCGSGFIYLFYRIFLVTPPVRQRRQVVPIPNEAPQEERIW